jgi:hypothetical protein
MIHGDDSRRICRLLPGLHGRRILPMYGMKSLPSGAIFFRQGRAGAKPMGFVPPPGSAVSVVPLFNDGIISLRI